MQSPVLGQRSGQMWRWEVLTLAARCTHTSAHTQARWPGAILSPTSKVKKLRRRRIKGKSHPVWLTAPALRDHGELSGLPDPLAAYT